MSDDRWVSCSRDMSWAVSAYRHRLRTALGTVCGASATHADIWRGNTTKPDCPRCEEAKP